MNLKKVREGECPTQEDVTMKRIEMEVELFSERKRMTKELLNVDFGVSVDHICNDLVFRMNKRILAQEVDRVVKYVEYPEDWKQAVKERFFPKWLLRKYPVRYHRERIELKRQITFPEYNEQFPDDFGRMVFHVLDSSGVV